MTASGEKEFGFLVRPATKEDCVSIRYLTRNNTLVQLILKT